MLALFVGVGGMVLREARRPSTTLEARKSERFVRQGRRIAAEHDAQRASLSARLRFVPAMAPRQEPGDVWSFEGPEARLVARVPSGGILELVRRFAEELDRLDDRGWSALGEELGLSVGPTEMRGERLEVWLEPGATCLRVPHGALLPEGYALGREVRGEASSHLLLGLYLRELSGPVAWSDREAEALMAVLHPHSSARLLEHALELRLGGGKRSAEDLRPLLDTLFGLVEVLA